MFRIVLSTARVHTCFHRRIFTRGSARETTPGRLGISGGRIEITSSQCHAASLPGYVRSWSKLDLVDDHRVHLLRAGVEIESERRREMMTVEYFDETTVGLWFSLDTSAKSESCKDPMKTGELSEC